jgi:hypothetical protein
MLRIIPATSEANLDAHMYYAYSGCCTPIQYLHMPGDGHFSLGDESIPEDDYKPDTTGSIRQDILAGAYKPQSSNHFGY